MILIAVLVLTVVFSSLSLMLLSTTEVGMQSLQNGRRVIRAERAAQSGVEWGAAWVEANGLADWGVTSVTITDDVFTKVQIDPARDPNIQGKGIVFQSEIEAGANASFASAPFPYVFASWGWNAELNGAIHSQGRAYFEDDTSPIAWAKSRTGAPVLVLDDDLDMSVASLPEGVVQHDSGKTYLSVPLVDLPVVDTATLFAMTSGDVEVHRYTGNTTLSGQTIHGILLVDFENPKRTDKLTLENCAIYGTIVATTNKAGVHIDLTGSTVIYGGTDWTGNLAILAPGFELHAMSDSTASVQGVVYCAELNIDAPFQVVGGLYTDDLIKIDADVTVTVPDGWRPDLPVGLTLPNGIGTDLLLEWAGRL